VFVKLLSDYEAQVFANPNLLKIILVVEYQGHSIYKSTLVSQLNGNPYLSKDRIMRMKNSIYFKNSDDYLVATLSTTSMLLNLGSNVGVYFKDMWGNQTSSTIKTTKNRTLGKSIAINSGVENKTFYLGRV